MKLFIQMLLQLLIGRAALHQAFMITDACKPALFQDQNTICVLYRTEPVRNNDDRDFARHRIEGFKNPGFALGIQRAGGFV